MGLNKPSSAFLGAGATHERTLPFWQSLIPSCRRWCLQSRVILRFLGHFIIIDKRRGRQEGGIQEVLGRSSGSVRNYRIFDWIVDVHF